MLDAVYTCYLLLCMLQLPVFLTLLSIGVHPRMTLLVERTDLMIAHTTAHDANNNNNNITSSMTQPKEGEQDHNNNINNNNNNNNDLIRLFAPRACSIEPELGCMCAFAVLFATAYMVATRTEDADTLLAYEDAAHDGGDARGPLELSRACFWLFLWFHALAFVGCTVYPSSSTIGDDNHPGGGDSLLFLSGLRLQAGVRLAGLFGLCHTVESTRKHSMGHGAAAIAWGVWVVWTLSALIGARSHWLGWYLCQILVCDGLLILGHMWDTSTPAVTMLNCRLCFVACSGTVLILRLIP